MRMDISDESNRRKEKRVPLQVQLILEGVTNDGVALRTPVMTLNVSKSGVCFQTEDVLPIKTGDIIQGTLVNDNFKTSFKMRIVWKYGNRLGGFIGDSRERWFVPF